MAVADARTAYALDQEQHVLTVYHVERGRRENTCQEPMSTSDLERKKPASQMMPASDSDREDLEQLQTTPNSEQV